MRSTILLLGFALAACSGVNAPSGPPVSGTATGTAVMPERQQVREIGGANSPNASAGTPTYTGTEGARPSFDRSGTAGSGIGSATSPAAPPPRTARPN